MRDLEFSNNFFELNGVRVGRNPDKFKAVRVFAKNLKGTFTY
jgi:hypothetical protein